METQDSYYNRPVFRKGVIASVQEEEAAFSYAETQFDIQFSNNFAPSLHEFVKELEKGLDYDMFVSQHPHFTDHAGQLFSTLDRYGFITEAAMPVIKTSYSGPALWNEIDNFTTSYLENKDMPLSAAFLTSEPSREVIIAYALQYYQFVKMGPQIISAALSNADRDGVRSIMQDFLVSELNHDKLLLKALTSAGMDAAKISASLPIPETFALITVYYVLADQEPLSFYACVFLVEEEKPAFNEAFIKACIKAGLPKSFYDPILSHSKINEEENHGSISQQLLQNYSCISEEARIVILKQLQHIMDALIEMEKGIVKNALEIASSIK